MVLHSAPARTRNIDHGDGVSSRIGTRRSATRVRSARESHQWRGDAGHGSDTSKRIRTHHGAGPDGGLLWWLAAFAVPHPPPVEGAATAAGTAVASARVIVVECVAAAVVVVVVVVVVAVVVAVVGAAWCVEGRRE